jgi:hypothetical protein
MNTKKHPRVELWCCSIVNHFVFELIVHVIIAGVIAIVGLMRKVDVHL